MGSRLKKIFLASALLFIAHGIEEYLTGFYQVDPQFAFIFKPLFSMSVPQASFLLFQITLGITFILTAILLINEKWRIRLLILPGFFLFYEVHHIIRALGDGGYYPGLVTAILLPVLGIVFWKELLVNLKHASQTTHS